MSDGHNLIKIPEDEEHGGVDDREVKLGGVHLFQIASRCEFISILSLLRIFCSTLQDEKGFQDRQEG